MKRYLDILITLAASLIVILFLRSVVDTILTDPEEWDEYDSNNL